MAIPSDLNFAPGVLVNITMSSGQVFTGELVNSTDSYLQVKLTAASGPYVAGQVVLLLETDILAIG